jgi:hypothetical protein
MSGGTPKTSAARVDVLVVPEGLDQHCVGREMGQQAQFDLRVVGGEQHPARVRHESRADVTPEVATDGDVLQIGIRGREAPGGRAGGIERGVDAAGRIHQQRQRVDVGALELGELAIVEDLLHDGVRRRQSLQHVGGG